MTARDAKDPQSVRPTIPARFVTDMLRGSDSADRILHETGIDPGALDVPQFRVSARQFAAVYRSICRAHDDEFFGYLPRPVPRGGYLTLLRMLCGCVDARACADACRRFYRLFDRHDYWELTELQGATRLVVIPKDDAQRGSILFSLAMLLTLARSLAWLTSQPLRVDGLTLDPRFSEFAGECRFLFGRDPDFEVGSCALTFATPQLSAPVLRGPADVDAYAPNALDAMLLPAPRDTLATQIRRLLEAAEPIASTRLEEIADALDLSRQTLSRRMSERGLTLQGLKDELRRDFAIALLTKTQRSVAEIAAEVGYSEPSAFVRAFRSWVGVAPGRYRAGET